MLASLRPCPWCPGNQQATRLPLHISLASLAASKADAPTGIIDWLVQLCPSSDLQTSYLLSCYITSLSLAAIWKVWTWPCRWKSDSNYLAIQWERTLQHRVSDPVKLMVGNKSFSTNEGSGLLEVEVCSFIKPQSQVLMLVNYPALRYFRAVRLVSVK